MPKLPQGHQRLTCTIDGVIYEGSYWVDESKHLVHVVTQHGGNSAPAMRVGSNYERDKANRSAAQGLFEAMIKTHLAAKKGRP